MNLKLTTTLRLPMLLYILIPTAIILIAGSIGTFTFANNIMNDEAAAMGKAYAFTFENIFSVYSQRITTISAQEDSILAATGEFSVVSDSLTEQRKYFQNLDKNLLDIVFMDKNGGIVADGIGSNQGTIFFGYSDSLINTNKNHVYFSNLIINNEKYADDIFLAEKHIVSNGDTVGYIAAVISVDALGDQLADATYFSDGRIVLFDSNGNTINFNGDGQIVRKSEIPAPGIAQQIDQIIEKNTGLQTLDKPENINISGYLGSYNKISGTEWHWLAITSGSLLFAPINEFHLVSIFIILCMVVMMIVFTFIYTHRIIAPINNIIKASEEIKAGRRDCRIKVKSRNEFGLMSETLNELLDESVLSEELYKTISELSDNMLFEWDYIKKSMYVSKNLSDKFAVDPTKCTLDNGLFIESLMDEDTATVYRRNLSGMLRRKDKMNGEYRIKTKNGSPIWVSVRAQVVTDRLGETLRVLGVLTDIDVEKNLALKLSERASYDFLSQLYNRITFERELTNELERNADNKLAVMFIDVDDFKHINDRFSHAVGDEVIKFVSGVLKKSIKNHGFAGRFGGDEFIMCITDMEMLPHISVLAENIIQELYSGYYIKEADITLNIRASIGVALAPQHGRKMKKLIARADEAMYYVKKNGKSSFRIYSPDMYNTENKN